MGEGKCLPWKDGYYKLNSVNRMVFLVSGEKVKSEKFVGKVDDTHLFGTWEFGDFGESRDEITKYTGKKNYNVNITLWDGMWKAKGTLNDDGTKITVWNLANELDHFEKISEEDYSALKESGDPASAPSSHYKIQPDFNGKLLWISGAPGLGKSTTGLILSKTADYVYYEADAFGSHVNPYIPPDAEEPSLATRKQKPLKEVPQDRIDAVDNGIKDFKKLIEGKEYCKENVEGYYTALCKDIQTEKKRMGGNWVVAQAVPFRSLRDHIKKQLGPDLMFVVLNMTKEDQMKRILSRHGNHSSAVVDWLTKLYDLFEPAKPDEKNAIDIEVTGDMSRDDVVDKIFKMLPS